MPCVKLGVYARHEAQHEAMQSASLRSVSAQTSRCITTAKVGLQLVLDTAMHTEGGA